MKYQQNPDCLHRGVNGINGNEPIEDMQFYMEYCLEKLERRLGLN